MSFLQRNLEEFNNRYPGRTCFIIGSGCSINYIHKDFHLLSSHITIAVNSGYVAYPQSDFFVSDDWSVANWSYFFDDLTKSKHTVALLYDQKLGHTASRFGERAVIFKHRRGYELTAPYSHFDRTKFIWEARTSVGSAIHIAHIMGCRYIVLLGIDGRRVEDYRYFWQMPNWIGPKPFRNDQVRIDHFRRCTIKNKPADVDLLSINQYWERIGKTPGLNLYNASPISLIESIAPVTFLNAINGDFASRTPPTRRANYSSH